VILGPAARLRPNGGHRRKRCGEKNCL